MSTANYPTKQTKGWVQSPVFKAAENPESAFMKTRCPEAGLKCGLGFSEVPLPNVAAPDSCVPPEKSLARTVFGPFSSNNGPMVQSEAYASGLHRSEHGRLQPHPRSHREALQTRFLAGGHATMPDSEILELLLFNAIPRSDVRALAKRLLESFRDLNGVVAASRHRLLQVRGASEKVYLQLRIAEAFAQRMARAKVLDRNVITSWVELIAYCRTSMAHRETEQFRILFLDRRNTVIADEEQATGTVDHVPVYPREVVKRALELNAGAIVLVHNHPSGDPTPSRADIEMTQHIDAACKTISVTIHDHIIIGKEGEYSFHSAGLL